MGQHQLLDNVGGVDAVWQSHQNVDAVRGHEAAVKRRPSLQQMCHVVSTFWGGGNRAASTVRIHGGQGGRLGLALSFFAIRHVETKERGWSWGHHHYGQLTG